MKLLKNLKVPFGTAKVLRVTSAKYLAWEDAFEVDFEDGLTFLEPHATMRKANRISPKAQPIRVELEEEPCIGFSFTPAMARPPKSRRLLSASCLRGQRERNADFPRTLMNYPLQILTLALVMPLTGFAQVNSGSDGHDGALNPASNLVIDMADHPDGIYHYTSVNIPAGRTN